MDAIHDSGPGAGLSPITLEVISPSGESGPVNGFSSLWAKYVSGFDETKHCQACLRGTVIHDFSGRRVTTGTPVVLDRTNEYPYVYVCGVAAGPTDKRGERNLHLPLRPAPGKTVELQTYNGYLVRATNAEAVGIPEPGNPQPGRPDSHIRCKNYRFGRAAFAAKS